MAPQARLLPGGVRGASGRPVRAEDEVLGAAGQRTCLLPCRRDSIPRSSNVRKAKEGLFAAAEKEPESKLSQAEEATRTLASAIRIPPQRRESACWVMH